MKQLLSLLFALLFGVTVGNNLDYNGILDTSVSLGNDSGIVRQSPENLFMSLDKRQTCAAGYGTCPGGVTCGCATTDNCCGSICKYRSQICCTNFICESNEFCCGGTLYPKSCRPAGTQCCFDGTYCISGTYCIKYDNENFARCRVVGATSEPPPRSTQVTTPYVPLSTTTYVPLSTTTYVPAQVTTRYYTITYTVYWYYFYYYSFTTYYAPSTFTLSSVRSSYTSTPTILSAYATGSADASRSLSNDVSDIQSSFSRSALSSSSSMSSVCSAASSSYSSRVRLLSTASSTASSTGSSSGNSGVTQSSTGISLSMSQHIVMFVWGIFVAMTGILMIAL